MLSSSKFSYPDCSVLNTGRYTFITGQYIEIYQDTRQEAILLANLVFDWYGAICRPRGDISVDIGKENTG